MRTVNENPSNSEISQFAKTKSAPLAFLAKFIPTLAIFADSLALIATGFLTYNFLVYYNFRTVDTYNSAIIFNWLVCIGLQYFAGLYHVEPVLRPTNTINRVIISLTTSFALMLAAAFSLKVSDDISRIWVVVFFVANIASLVVTKYVLATALSQLEGRDLIARSIFLFGDHDYVQRLMQHIQETKPRFVAVKGIFEDKFIGTNKKIDVVRLNQQLDKLIAAYRTQTADDIIIALPLSADQEISTVIERLRELPTNIYLGADLIGYKKELRSPPEHFAGMPIFEMVGKPLTGWDYLLKIIEDYVIATILFIVLLPVFAIIAIMIKIESSGPVFFKQKRYGFNNQMFDIYKFRSMKTEHIIPDTTVQAIPGDTRITRLGRVLRKTSLDELPQLLNVLNGSMSLVGPRPHAVDHNEDYAKNIRGYFGRHRMKPGMTGLAQVKGFRGLTDTIDKMENRVKYDIIYTDNWSIGLDIKILLKTALVVLWPKNAH